MARVRIPRQAHEHRHSAAANRALSSPARLADVVRGYERPFRSSVVCTFPGQTAPRRSRYAEPASRESVPRPSAAVRPRGAIPVRLHLARRTEAKRPVVEATVGGSVFPENLTAGRRTPPGLSGRGLEVERTRIKALHSKPVRRCAWRKARAYCRGSYGAFHLHQLFLFRQGHGRSGL